MAPFVISEFNFCRKLLFAVLDGTNVANESRVGTATFRHYFSTGIRFDNATTRFGCS